MVSRKFEQSTTVASQRHLGGHTGLLLQSLFKRVSSAPEIRYKDAFRESLLLKGEQAIIQFASHILFVVIYKTRFNEILRYKQLTWDVVLFLGCYANTCKKTENTAAMEVYIYMKPAKI